MYFKQIDDAITVHLRHTGKTQMQLAKELGVAPNTFSWKRRGVREWTLSEVSKLSEILGTTPSELLSRASYPSRISRASIHHQ